MMMRGGVAVPVHTDRPSRCTLIHEDDILATIPGLLRAASVPATIVNWAGQEHVSIEEWCAYLGELAGPATVSWKDGLRRMVEARAPELLGRP